MANAHTIDACTNTVPASATPSTARSAPTVSFPTAPPHLITNVLTSDSTVQDIKATDLVHDTLAAKDLL
ncbi:hypothetical protein AB0I68_31375, partial [Streptomyces sp. NPDC050448]